MVTTVALRRSPTIHRNARALSAALQLAAEVLGLDTAALLRDGSEILTVQVPNSDDGSMPAHAAASNGSTVVRDATCASMTLAAGSSRSITVRFERRAGPEFTPHERSLGDIIARSMTATRNGLDRLMRESEHANGECDPHEHEALPQMVHDRDALLVQLPGIQRALSQRAPLQDILDAIVTAAAELIGDETVNLRLLDPSDPTRLIRVAGRAYSDEVEPLHEVDPARGRGRWPCLRRGPSRRDRGLLQRDESPRGARG